MVHGGRGPARYDTHVSEDRDQIGTSFEKGMSRRQSFEGMCKITLDAAGLLNLASPGSTKSVASLKILRRQRLTC
jgi:hypothetical protein